MEEIIIAQNPELDLESGKIDVRFIYTTKRGQTNEVIEVGPKTRGNFSKRN